MFLRVDLALSFSMILFGCFVNARSSSRDVKTCADHFGVDFCQHKFLHWAALSGDVNGTLHAIRMGNDINKYISGYGTPLHQAAFYGRADVVKILLQYGADPSIIDSDGDTPIAAKGMNWCSKYPEDRTCQMDVFDYRETRQMLTIGCAATGCGEGFQCSKQKCVDHCGNHWCGLNAICDVHNDRPVCRCKGETYHGDPAYMCFEIGEAKYLYRAYDFVKDVVTTISSTIVSDINSLMKKS